MKREPCELSLVDSESLIPSISPQPLLERKGRSSLRASSSRFLLPCSCCPLQETSLPSSRSSIPELPVFLHQRHRSVRQSRSLHVASRCNQVGDKVSKNWD